MKLCLLDLASRSITASPTTVVKISPLKGRGLDHVIVFSQLSVYIDGWLYGMRMTSVVCNVPVLSQNDSTYHHSVFTA